ncbi:MAG TPA: endoribonuclease MazF [Polyangiaceae bacterium]
MTKPYVPDRGDLVWLEFDPQAGHEQAGRRPAFVVSPRGYNQRAGLALMCPITTKSKGYPFEVEVAAGTIAGCILADQLKSLDYRARRVKFVERAEPALVDEVLAKVAVLVT